MARGMSGCSPHEDDDDDDDEEDDDGGDDYDVLQSAQEHALRLPARPTADDDDDDDRHRHRHRPPSQEVQDPIEGDGSENPTSGSVEWRRPPG